MERDPFNPVGAFDADVSPEVQVGIVSAIFTSYELANQEVDERHPGPESRDALPHIRNAHVNRLLRELMGQFPMVFTKSAFNEARNCHHTEVFSNQTLLTASAVDSPEEKALPRKASFRRTLARDPQASLFSEMEEGNIVAEPQLYAIVTHCATDDQRSPASIRVVFPNAECTKSLDHVDLLYRHRNQAQQPSIVCEEQVSEPQTPGIRRKDAETA